MRRHILSSQAGHALEILGHAIDYLADELVHEGGAFVEDHGRIQAIQLLMARNREIYFDCPVELTWGERLHDMRSHLLPAHKEERRGAVKK